MFELFVNRDLSKLDMISEVLAIDGSRLYRGHREDVAGRWGCGRRRSVGPILAGRGVGRYTVGLHNGLVLVLARAERSRWYD